MRTFEAPEIDTTVLGKVGFESAFDLTLEYDGPYVTQTARGGRIYKGIIGGKITGRINGTVYPRGGSEFPLRRDDGVEDLNSHIMLRADNGEWLYLRALGYDRPDDYYRTVAWIDADVRGRHTWTQGVLFIGIGEESADGKGIIIHYYELV